jgi:PBP1b-binding outer membrane lipoprotein LpoB
MKKLTFITLLIVLFSSCSDQLFDPTHPREASKAKAIRAGHTRGFAGPN